MGLPFEPSLGHRQRLTRTIVKAELANEPLLELGIVDWVDAFHLPGAIVNQP